MKNEIEKLFEAVLANLKPAQELEWPNTPSDSLGEKEIDEPPGYHGASTSPVDYPVDSPDDDVSTISEEQKFWRILDRMQDGRHAPRQLDDQEAEAIEGSIRARGFETLAFYKSRRLLDSRPFPGKWGIFYLGQGLIYVESHIAQDYPGYGDPRSLALDFLRMHERFHYRADIQTLLFEATLGRHLYLPLHYALRGIRSHFVEEALANRQVWDWARKRAIGLEEFAYDFMMLQPNAYARFDEPRLGLAAEWAGTVIDQKPPGSSARADLAHWIEVTPPGLLRPSLCPEYLVTPRDFSRWVSPALVLPPVTDVQDGDEVAKLLQGQLRHLRNRWERTKAKLMQNRLLHGLNFKPWPKDGPERYSVRVSDNVRAHLHYLGSGQWSAYALGPHKKLGHG
jgi:hypothetical protein